LTVIICAYNRGFILGDCLESLARQTTPPDPLFPYYDYEHGKFTAKASNILRCFGPISV
jgi:hypothetical protein